MKKLTVAAMVLVLGGAFVLVAQPKRTEAATAEVTAPAPGEGVAQAAIKKAADAKKFLFLFVSESDNEETATAKRAVEAAATKIGDKAELAFIKRDGAAEKATIEKFQLDRAPMPMVLALAPNGAITGAFFGEKLKDPQLQGSIAGEAEQQCMKALQDGKLVFLCAQNGATKSNDAAMQGVNDFKADKRFADTTEIVKVDPASASEQSFLAKLKIDPKATDATTAFLAPPGSVVSKVTGATTKGALEAALTAASSGACCSGGAGAKGCCPK